MTVARVNDRPTPIAAAAKTPMAYSEGRRKPVSVTPHSIAPVDPAIVLAGRAALRGLTIAASVHLAMIHITLRVPRCQPHHDPKLPGWALKLERTDSDLRQGWVFLAITSR